MTSGTRLALGLAALALGCRTPTQITLEVSTDTGCPNQKTAIVIGHAGDIDTRPPTTTTSQCDPQTGRIGDLVVVPSGADDEDIAFEVIAGLNKDPDGCRPPDPGNLAQCIIARRALRFIPHEQQTVPILLSQACVDHYCPPGQTCVFGMCQDEALPPLPGPEAGPDAVADVTSDMPASPRDAALDTSVGFDATPPDAGAPILVGTPSSAKGTLAFLAVSGGVAYVSDATSNVSRCDTNGCVTFSPNLPSPNRMAVDSANVYWAGYQSPGGVFGCRQGPSCAAVVQYAGSRPVSALATDGVDLFWSSGMSSSELVYSCPSTNCATPTQISTWFGSAGSIATDGTSVYWTDFGGGAILAVPYGSVAAAANTLAGGESSPFGVASDGSSVYWTTYVSAGELRTVARGGGQATSLATMQSYAHDLAYDGSAALYWTNAGTSGVGDGSVMKCVLPGCQGGLQTLASGRAHPWGIAVDATWVYWTERDSGQVWKMPK